MTLTANFAIAVAILGAGAAAAGLYTHSQSTRPAAEPDLRSLRGCGLREWQTDVYPPPIGIKRSNGDIVFINEWTCGNRVDMNRFLSTIYPR